MTIFLGRSSSSWSNRRSGFELGTDLKIPSSPRTVVQSSHRHTWTIEVLRMILAATAAGLERSSRSMLWSLRELGLGLNVSNSEAKTG